MKRATPDLRTSLSRSSMNWSSAWNSDSNLDVWVGGVRSKCVADPITITNNGKEKKKKMKRILIAIVGMMFLAGCATTNAP
jgi:hypothetical protein